MQKDDVIRFLEHILGRQKKFGPEDAFRFRIYLKKQQECRSKYPEEQLALNTKTSSKEKGKKKGKGKGKKGMQDKTDDPSNGVYSGTAADNENGDMVIDPILLQIDAEMRSTRLQQARPIIERIPAGIIDPCGLAASETVAAAGQFDDTPTQSNSPEIDSRRSLLPISTASLSTLDVICGTEAGPSNLISTQIKSSRRKSSNTAAENQININNKKQSKAKSRVGKSDAIALEEGKRYLRNLKRRR